MDIPTSPRRLQSALIELYARRAQDLSAHQVYRQHRENLFAAPSVLGQREVTRFQSTVMEAIPPDVRMLELSPVAPLGSNSVLSGISQKTVLGTIRNTEVVADAVSVLAFEAIRRRETPGGTWPVTLGTFHRELRTQVYGEPQYKPHYHALSLVSADDRPDFDEFKRRGFAKHIMAYLDVLARAEKIGYASRGITVTVSNLRVVELLIKALGADRSEVRRHARTVGYNVFDSLGVDLPRRVPFGELAPLLSALKGSTTVIGPALAYAQRLFDDVRTLIEQQRGRGCVDLVFDLARHSGMGYYQDLSVKISASNLRGEHYEMADIGTNDWLGRITHRRGDRLMTGGMSVELFMTFFKDPARLDAEGELLTG